MITTIDPHTVPPPPGGWYSQAARVGLGAGALLPDCGAVRARYVTRTPATSTIAEVARLYRPDALLEVDLVPAIGG